MNQNKTTGSDQDFQFEDFITVWSCFVIITVWGFLLGK